jgi:isopenicillin-N epimerase
MRDDFLLDPGVVHLNHGAFGACPRPVFESYQHWQRVLERHPSAILSYGYDAHMDGARERLASYLGCEPTDVVLTQGTTSGLNSVARSLPLRPGDEILGTDQEYEAMDVLWEQACADAGARYVRQPLPLPANDQGALVDALFSAVGPSTRVICCSHITSRTAIQLPIADICRRARGAGIMTIVDGAHAPGQIPLGIAALGADVYAASCHKWLCAPRGSGFLFVRPEYQDTIVPPLVSHGSQPGSTFLERFRWQGTRDACAFLSLPCAIEFQQRPEWIAQRQRCHGLARRARSEVGELFGLEPLTPDSQTWFNQMAAAPLPPCDEVKTRHTLLDDYNVDAPVRTWAGGSLIRISVQAYNNDDDIDRLIEALQSLFAHR